MGGQARVPLRTREGGETHAAGGQNDPQNGGSVLEQHHVSAGVSSLHYCTHTHKSGLNMKLVMDIKNIYKTHEYYGYV